MITRARNEEKAQPSALARFGFLSRGIVCVLIGGIATRPPKSCSTAGCGAMIPPR
jgi:hypothetical protein